MAKIFFSYAREDKALVHRVRAALEEHHEIWTDENISSDLPFMQSIEIAIEDCNFFAIFMTENSKASSWVRRELSAYMVKDINNGTNTILPLKFDETDIREFGPFLASINYFDFTQENFDTVIKNILARIRREKIVQNKVSEEDYQRLLFSIDLAINAGNTAMMYYRSSLQDNLPLDYRKNAATLADTNVEDKVLELIQLRYGNETVISEERNKEDPYKNIDLEGYTWVIDPLDGTNNFVNGLGFFCSAIGILKNGEPFIGVIYDPIFNEVYFAVQGQPSRLWHVSTGEINHISSDLSTRTLKQSLIATHISSRPEVTSDLFKHKFLFDIANEFEHVRMLGCGQLALAYVASGKLQAFMQLQSYIWDQVAGVVILLNANGIVQDFEPLSPILKEWNYKTKNILACSNEAILNEFRGKFLDKNP